MLDSNGVINNVKWWPRGPKWGIRTVLYRYEHPCMLYTLCMEVRLQRHFMSWSSLPVEQHTNMTFSTHPLILTQSFTYEKPIQSSYTDRIYYKLYFH